MAEIECTRCLPGVTRLTSVITCMGRGGSAEGAAPRGVDVDQMRLPYYGKGRSKNMYGAGFVVGFKGQAAGSARTTNGNGNRWRLDYDPDKGLHVNYESDGGDVKICHRFGVIDAQPFVAKAVPMPVGLKKMEPEQQIRRMWFAWTQHYLGSGQPTEDVQTLMQTAYGDLYIKSFESFRKTVVGAEAYEHIAHLLRPVGS